MENMKEESVGSTISDLKDQILNSIHSEVDNLFHISVCLSKFMGQINDKIQSRESLISELRKYPFYNVCDKGIIYLTLIRDQDLSTYRSISRLLQDVKRSLKITCAFEEILKRL